MSSTLAPDHILQQLSAMWVELGKQENPEASAGVLRACTMTLVALATDRDEIAKLEETLVELMPSHPARTVVLYLGKDEPLNARVNSQCWLPFGGRKQICCEHVELTGPPDRLPDLSSVLLPIAAPDMPVVLWCRSADTAASAPFNDLVRMVQKIVVDTTGASDSRAAVEQLGSLVKRGVVLGELSWTHLTRWRETIAQIFDNASYLSRLPGISQVNIRFTGPQTEVMARYLGAWLKDALANAGANAKVNLEGGASVASVELAGSGFRVELKRDGDRLVTTVDGLSHCVSLPQATDCQLLREELGIIRRDPVFERALASAGRI